MAEGGNSAQIWVAAIGAVAAIATALIAAGAVDVGLGKHKPSEPAASATPSPAPPPSASPTPAPSPSPSPTPEAAADLDGKWAAPDQVITTITQAGDAVNLQSAPVFNGTVVTYSANGTIAGHKLEWDFTSTIGDGGHCDTIVSHDATLIQGDCRHGNGLVTSIHLTRQ